MQNFENLTEVATHSQEIFDGIILHLFKDTVTLPNGNSATREVIRHVGAVGVIPMTDDGKVIIERQFRYPLNRVITEIPAGKLDSFSEDRLSAAKRELEEETGVTGLAMELVGVFSRPGRAPRGWVVSAAYAAVLDEAPAVGAGDDAASAEWYAVKRSEDGLLLCRDGKTVPVEQLAFDHREVLSGALERHAAVLPRY